MEKTNVFIIKNWKNQEKYRFYHQKKLEKSMVLPSEIFG
jgi:hypothetical protein